MGTRKVGKSKKIVVLGVGVEHHPIYEDALSDHKVIFAGTSEEAISQGKNADLIAVNIDKHNGFLGSMFERLYDGKVVAIATSRKLLNKLVELPSGAKISPVCCHSAPVEIMRLLAV